MKTPLKLGNQKLTFFFFFNLKSHTRIYTIIEECGFFEKGDYH